MWTRVKEWYVAVIGLIVIAGGLYLAAHTASNDGTTNEQAKQTATSAAPQPVNAPNAPSGSTAQQPARTEATSVTSASSTPAVAPTAPVVAAQNAAPAAHNHAPDTSQTNIAQAPAAAPTPAPASQAGSNVGTPALIAGGDPAAGKLVFRKCQVCHSLDPGKDILGPSLAGVFGRRSGAEPNYAYSPAMKDANLTWDAKTLDAYLDDPQKTVPGNKMPFPGLKTPQDRSDVIAYLAAPAASAAVQPSPPPAAAQQVALSLSNSNSRCQATTRLSTTL